MVKIEQSNMLLVKMKDVENTRTINIEVLKFSCDFEL